MSRKHSHLPLQRIAHDCDAALKALYAVLPLQQLSEVPEFGVKMTVSPDTAVKLPSFKMHTCYGQPALTCTFQTPHPARLRLPAAGS